MRRLIGAPTAPPLPCCAVTDRGFPARAACEITQAMGFRRCMLRGLAKVRGEWHLVCAAFNLRQLQALGVGRA